MSRKAADNRTVPWIGVVDDHVADADPLYGAYRRAVGGAHAAAQANKDRRIRHISHGDVRDRDVLDVGPVDALQRQSTGSIEHYVGDRDVAEIAFRFLSLIHI